MSKDRMRCWHCGKKMIWGADFDPEDFGLDGTGIISTFSCSVCPATAHVFLIESEEKEDDKKV